MKNVKAQLGDVLLIVLPDGRYAYGRLLKEGAVAFYRTITSNPDQPPIGSRDFQFVVGVYKDVVDRLPIVGHDPSGHPEEDWPPPGVVRDPITKQAKLYHKGAMRPASEEEVRGLEPVAAWDLHYVVDRLMGKPTTN